VIVKLEPKRGTFLVDWGTLRGAYQGMKVQVYRRVELLHPVTKKKLYDRFLIGEATLLQVSRYLSIGKPKGPFRYPASVGDFVVSSKGQKAPSAQPGKASTTGPMRVIRKTVIKYKRLRDPDLEALERAWRSIRGKSLRARLKRWAVFA